MDGPPSPSYSNVPTELPSPNRGNQTVSFESQPDNNYPQAGDSSRPASKPPTPKSPQDYGGHTTYSAPSLQATTTQKPPPSWLMPWQTGWESDQPSRSEQMPHGNHPTQDAGPVSGCP
eukprot:scaffold42309_cov23-Tisochrysis_lutea.AAC.1